MSASFHAVCIGIAADLVRLPGDQMPGSEVNHEVVDRDAVVRLAVKLIKEADALVKSEHDHFVTIREAVRRVLERHDDTHHRKQRNGWLGSGGAWGEMAEECGKMTSTKCFCGAHQPSPVMGEKP